MSLILDPTLPAAEVLRQEGFTVLDRGSATPDLRIGLINLMPKKQETELDFMRMLGGTNLSVEVELIYMGSHVSRSTNREYIQRYYRQFPEVAADGLDGLIVTGAPLDNVAFENVDYWEEICSIFDYVRDLRIPTFNVCWGAFAWVYHYYGIGFWVLPRKISGIYPNRINYPDDPIMKGLDAEFYVPCSRFASWPQQEIRDIESEIIVAESDCESGIYILKNREVPVYSFVSHGEYSTLTLDSEYRRDLGRNLNPHIPENYYPNDDPEATPVNTWTVPARKIYANWLHSIKSNQL